MKKPCRKCFLCEKRKRIVEASGSDEPDVVFIIEVPEPSDDVTGKILSGPSGNLFRKLLTLSGIVNYRVIPIVACRLPYGVDLKPESVIACSSRFLNDIRSVHPKVFVFFGKESFRWYKREFASSRIVLHPAVVYLSGGERSPYILTVLQQLTDIKEVINAED